jgi:hypothetical protein
MLRDALRLGLLLLLLGSLCTCRAGNAADADLPPPENDQRRAGGPPELPRISVELPSGAESAPNRVLRAGDNLQDAIDDAKPGDVIALEPGAVFEPVTLPRKEGSGWITIRTRIADGALPRAGNRVNPTHAHLMPTIEATADPAIAAAPGAHHFRFIGIEMRPQPGVFTRDLVLLGTNSLSLKTMPHHFVIERCYLHGDPRVGGRRGVALNSRHTAVLDSYLSDFKEQGVDSQAIAGWNGLGPFLIVNNYLEGAGENLLFGGADPAMINLVPADIDIRRNHFAKPLSWRIGSREYAGTPWTVKNLFELKNARRVRVDGNLFEYNWEHAQNGFAILFTPRNQNGAAPWSMVEDVTFTHNIVRHAASAINILGKDDIHASQQTKRILIQNNRFEDIDQQKWGGTGKLFQLLSGTADVVIDHNTGFQTGDVIYAEGQTHTGFVYTNNVSPHNRKGVTGRYLDTGNSTLAKYFPGARFVQNVLIGGNPSLYPPNNSFPASSQQWKSR